jgi:hypothetical protein
MIYIDKRQWIDCEYNRKRAENGFKGHDVQSVKVNKLFYDENNEVGHIDITVIPKTCVKYIEIKQSFNLI